MFSFKRMSFNAAVNYVINGVIIYGIIILLEYFTIFFSFNNGAIFD